MQTIQFQDRKTPVVFPVERSDLMKVASELQLNGGHPVIVLIGGEIDKKQADVTSRVIRTISQVAEDLNAAVLCGGTDMGVMAEIGRVRFENSYHFPLVGVSVKEMVAWPGGPANTKFLLWGTKRWSLEPHYSHFVLVPGQDFGDESPWIVNLATILSKANRSMTILINGGKISRKDIELSLAINRPVLALSRTGRLADEISRQVDRNKLITVIPAYADSRIIDSIQETLSTSKPNDL